MIYQLISAKKAISGKLFVFIKTNILWALCFFQFIVVVAQFCVTQINYTAVLGCKYGCY